MTPQVLVLIGGGHAHIQVILNLPPSATVILISENPLAAYSGMLPAALAGLIDESRAHVDLKQLCARHGVHFVHARVTGIESAKKEVRFVPPRGGVCRMRYDALSVNVGSRTVGIPTVGKKQGTLPMVVYTRPILNLVSSVRRFEEALKENVGTVPRIVVVGGGAAGIEIILALEARMKKTIGKMKMTLISKRESFAEGFGRQAGNAVAAELKRRDVDYVVGKTATRINLRRGVLEVDAMKDVPFELLVVATGAAPHEWLKETDLEVDEEGWLIVDDKLRCVGKEDVFAAGDCVSFGEKFGKGFPPRAGVYAVREGPVLTHNLKVAFEGGSWKVFRPQTSFLSLLSTGDGRGVGSKYGLVFRGSWVYRLKNFIDESWQERFRGGNGGDNVIINRFEGSAVEGGAILQAAEDVLVGDCFEVQLAVLKRMDEDEVFREELLQVIRGGT